MVLVDTSVWINHLRTGKNRLEVLLLDAEVICHPYVIGELACGNIRNRDEILSLLQALPLTPTLASDEFLLFINRNKLMGMGIGFVDVQLLASARLAAVPLWTADRRLHAAAAELSIAYPGL